MAIGVVQVALHPPLQPPLAVVASQWANTNGNNRSPPSPLYAPPLQAGENDATTSEIAEYYPCELTALAGALRAAFASPDAHWVTIQLAPYSGGAPLAPFRAMQCDTTWGSIPNASCAVIVDDGDPLSPIGNVHSRNKQLVGARVAVHLAAALYDAPYPAMGRGPQYASASLASEPSGALQANVSFDPATFDGGSLVYVAPFVSTWSNSTRCPVEIGISVGECDWFNILGSNGIAYNASVAIAEDGITLQLSATAPAGVTAVGTRFGWNDWPVSNYYSTHGFPVVPWNVTASG